MGECHNLKTVVLSQNMTSLPLKAFTDCHSLKKLYIPERVGEIGEDCFYRTPVNIYGETGSAAEDVVKDNVNFISLDDHEHNLEEVTFFSFDTWAVVGSYCRDCGYAEDVRVSYKKNLPAVLIQEEEIYSEPCVELNEENTDLDGILYELDESTMTAEVKGINTGGEHPGELIRGIIWIPGKVIKGEKEYVVEAMGNSALWGGRASTVVLPDTVKWLNSNCFGSTVKKIVLGEGVENIHEGAFANMDKLEWIEIRGENPNFTVEGNAFYNKDKTELIRVMSCGEGTTCEFTVPNTVSSIWEYAFVQSRWKAVFSLIRIRISSRNNIQELRDTDRWFANCYACISYQDQKQHRVDTPIWLPDFIKPTSSPDTIPSASPTTTSSSETGSATPPASASPQNPSASPMTGLPVYPTKTLAPEDHFQGDPAVMSSAVVPASATGAESGSDGSDAKSDTYRQELAVAGFKSSLTSEGYVKLVWKRNVRAKCYRIYRASSKNGEYKLLRMVSKARLTYIDKTVRKNKKYFYKITTLGVFDNKVIEGEASRTSLTCISGLRIPEISVKKGKIGEVHYITVTFKKYAGKNADIYISIGKRKKFKKLKLVSSKIARYKGKFKIRCMVKKQEIWVKVRTYGKTGTKKVYSGFSQVVRVKM
ncbi:MAG: leucine-rich repeat protein [Roseburia sp.]|nr:leucine-rich repeat protein [Roseburia sp.]